MNIYKQHIVLSLINAGRYSFDCEKCKVYSHIGKEKRILQPIKHYTGYRQYRLDVGFNKCVMVYAHQFSYLFMWREPYNPEYVIDHIDGDNTNNHPDNLRCITQKENNNAPGVAKGQKIRRVRLPVDVRHRIRTDAATGVSFVVLAERYKTTRQTISNIVGGKKEDNMYTT